MVEGGTRKRSSCSTEKEQKSDKYLDYSAKKGVCGVRYISLSKFSVRVPISFCWQKRENLFVAEITALHRVTI